MKTLHNVHPTDFKQYDTQTIRDRFVMEELFSANNISSFYSHVDRMITLGIMPVDTVLDLADFISSNQTGTEFFLQRRELGIVNVAGSAKVYADDVEYILEKEDAIYIAKDTKVLKFESLDESNPAKLYAISSPADKQLTTKLIKKQDALEVHAGASNTSNQRVIRQYLHPDVVETCKLLLGITSLAEGSVWNTMPAHTHDRRMEIYFYFDLNQEDIVMHFMGEPTETRHIVMQNEQALVSPSWSIHSGCGTSNYKFIWAMAGENQTYTDMDFIANTNLR